MSTKNVVNQLDHPVVTDDEDLAVVDPALVLDEAAVGAAPP